MFVYTVGEVSKRLKICERTCWDLIRSGRMAATRITPRTVRITEGSIEDFLINNTSYATGADGDVFAGGVDHAA